MTSSVELMLQGPFRELTRKILSRAKEHSYKMTSNYFAQNFNTNFQYFALFSIGNDALTIEIAINKNRKNYKLRDSEKELFEAFMLDVKERIIADSSCEKTVREDNGFDEAAIDFFKHELMQNNMVEFVWNEALKEIKKLSTAK